MIRSARLALVFVLALRAGALSAADPPAGAKPNIVFILADDWGWGDLSRHGHPWLKTPHL
ncbi:MAG: N-acetylgalactosamine-6-sulfatase, partial [Kiritimatiellia bacterium]